MSKVYFSNTRTRKHADSKIAKISRLLDALNLDEMITPQELVAIKLHFGEYGNDTHLNPTFARKVVEKVIAAQGKPFLTDTTTLYSGSRSNAVDHLETAIAHGFDYAVVKAPVIIADGLTGLEETLVDVNLKHFKQVRIATALAQTKSMVVLSHFKGHEMAGFGGAIKNLAMGCASYAGKRDQHGTKVNISKKTCIGCKSCIKICPQAALSLSDEKKAVVDASKCIGCFECITVCQPKAINLNWATEMPAFMERLTEYAYGATLNKKIAYINFVLNVTPDCDCAAWSDAPLVPDIGLLASTDPVALDQACFDLVKAQQSCDGTMAAGLDKFTARWTHTLGEMQLTYGESIGLGSTKYELINV